MRVPGLEQTLSLDPTDAIIKLSEQLEGQSPEELTIPQQKVLFVIELESEVNNGGFSQYFYNSAGAHAHETVAVLEELGEKKAHALLSRAIKVFPSARVPIDREERADVIDQMDEAAEEKWEAIDDKYYESNSDLAPLLIEYVRKNQSEF